MGTLDPQSGGWLRGATGGSPVGVFGKLPKLGEFARVHMVGEPMKSFETWLEQAMSWGASHRGDAWSSAYGAGPIHAFVYRAPGQVPTPDALVGIIGPSVDSVGRKFPLVVFSTLNQSTLAPHPHLIPLMLGEFLEAATGVLMDSARFASVAALTEQVGQLRPPRTDGFGERAREYEIWRLGTSLASAWGAIYEDPYSPRPFHALHTIFEALAPFRGRDRPNTPLSVRLPLGMGGAAATAFWIDVVRSIGRWSTNVPTVFWSSDGVTGSVLIQLGDVPTSSLAELWSPDPDSDHVCDLTTPSSVDEKRFLGRLPQMVAKTLERPNTLVVEFLRTLREAM